LAQALLTSLAADANNGSLLCSKVASKLVENVLRREDSEGYCTRGWLAELRFEAADDGYDSRNSA
jgi:hypothetical protein